ncbi:MAG: MerR family transcriptional regulator [Lachnospiraceae bacterium]|nr:MerR family transcriptional regulator [Lachnospiraceae bacterium]
MNSEKKFYTIGDISDMCSVPIKTLRYYDEIHLLVPNHRDSETNYRYYSEDQMLTLYIIRRLKSFGFTLEEIRTLVYSGDVKSLDVKLTEKATQIEKEIDGLKNLHHEIELTLERMKKGSNFISCFEEDKDISKIITQDPDGITVEEIPKINCIFTRKKEFNYQNANVSVARWFELFALVKKLNLKSIGVITLTYHNEALDQFLKKDCDLEVSLPVFEALDSPNFKVMGGYKAVTTVHVGSHSTIITSHIKALKWINQHSYKINGPISEEYIISPIDVKNENEYITKIIIPIE